MINKYIRVEEGSYRGHDMSGRVFPILKDYQTFAGDKQGGFVTVDCSELDGFEGLDKARVNVADIGKLTLTTEGAYIIHRDSLKADATETVAKATPENKETDEEAIEAYRGQIQYTGRDGRSGEHQQGESNDREWTARHW